MRVYLDVCCLNRPFDDQTQERIRLEAESVLLVLLRAQAGSVDWVSSEVVDYEIGLSPDLSRRSRLATIARFATTSLALTDDDVARGRDLESIGFGAFDALHVACAERAGADVLLTTDDKLLKRARRFASKLRVPVRNPLRWFLETMAP